MKSLALMVAALLLAHAGSGYAEPAASVQSQVPSGIQSKLEQASETIEQIKLKRENLIAQLQKIETQYGATAGSVRDLGLQIGGKQQRLKNISLEMLKRQTEFKLQSRELSKQVKAAFVMGKKEQLRLLLNQQDPALASRMLVYYNYLNKSRLNKLSEINRNIAALAKLEQEKQRETNLLGRVVRSHQTAQVGLSHAQKKRELLLIRLRKDYDKKSRQLVLLDADINESQALIDKLQQAALAGEKQGALTPAGHLDIDGNPITLYGQQEDTPAAFEAGVSKPFSELKGRMSWPVKGAIVKKFGSRRSETRWDGVLISAKEGTDIRAVSSGRVVFANWLRGYGLLIIVDHGHGYLTLYAFNQSLYKKVGEQIKAGTVIAAAGKSDGREESGLYFGIRSAGKPVDPVIWFKKG